MITSAFSRPLPAPHTRAAAVAASTSPPRGALAIFMVCACAGAGLFAGMQHEHSGTAVTDALNGTRATGWIAASGAGVVDATRSALYELGVRRIELCDATCAAQPIVATPQLVAEHPQAVIVSGSSVEAAALVHRLRSTGSNAMVVLAPPADPAEVVRRLPEDERRWLVAAVRVGSSATFDARTGTGVRARTSDPGAGSIRIAIVGDDGTLFD